MMSLHLKQKKLLLKTTIIASLSIGFWGCAEPQGDLTESEKVAEFNWLVTKFEHNYAPLNYKQDLFQFSWDAVKENYRNQISTTTSNDEFKVLMQSFVSEVKDAHTSLSEFTAGLPGGVDIAYLGFVGKRLVYNGVDGIWVTQLLPNYNPMTFSVKIGDFVKTVNGKAPYEYVRELCPQSLGREESDKTFLSARLSAFLSSECKMPTDTEVTLEIDRAGTPVSVKIPWVIDDYFAFVDSNSKIAEKEEVCLTEPRDSQNPDTWNIRDYYKYLQDRAQSRAVQMQNDEFRFVRITPNMLLNPVLKRNCDTAESKDIEAQYNPLQGIDLSNSSFIAKLFRFEGKNIGYVKIDTFSPATASPVQDFINIKAQFTELEIEALVIDLVNNGGGSLNYGIALAEEIRGIGIEPKMQVRFNDNWLSSIKQQVYFGENASVRQLAENVWEKLEAQRESGNWLSDPFALSELALNQPVGAKMDLPVVLMVNEMCASMCDIFSADLKANANAKLIGKNTMGAGGNVVSHGVSPRMAFMLSQTESLVIAPDGTYLENIGVPVTKDYEPTVSDILTDNIDFKRAAITYAFEQIATTAEETTGSEEVTPAL